LFQRLKLVPDDRNSGKELDALFHGHVENIGDGASLEQNLERFAVVALAVADVAGNVHIWQEVHLDLDDAVALAGLAAPTLDVERETARLVTARLRLGQPGKPVPDRRESAGIGGRIGARRAPDGALVDVDDLIEK